MTLQVKNQRKTKIGTQKQILEAMAKELAAKSTRWRYFLNFAQLEGIDSWKIVSFLHQFDSGRRLSQDTFVYARVAKVVATTEEWKVDETLATKRDVVNWNRQAIMAMIEAEKQGGFDLDKIERGLKAIEIINLLYLEFLLE